MVSRLQSLNLLQGIPPGCLLRATCRQGQSGAIVGSPQLSRHEEDFVAESPKSCPLKLRRQAESFDPVDQVVREQEYLEVGLIGEEVTGGNAAQGVLSFELLNQQFHSGAVVVKPPDRK